MILDAAKELSFEFLQYAAVNPNKAARVFLDGRDHSPAVVDKIAEKLSSEPFRLFAEADPKNAAEMLLLVQIATASTPGAVPMQQGAAFRTIVSGNKSEVAAMPDQERHQQKQFNASRRVHDEKGRITKPGPYDFVLGKGPRNTNHPGNIFFRAVAAKASPRYRQLQQSLGNAIYRSEKKHPMVKNLMNVNNRKGGAFLERKKDHFVLAEMPDTFYETSRQLLNKSGR